MCFGTQLCGAPSLTPLCLVVLVRGTSISNQTSQRIFVNLQNDNVSQRIPICTIDAAMRHAHTRYALPVIHFHSPAFGESRARGGRKINQRPEQSPDPTCARCRSD